MIVFGFESTGCRAVGSAGARGMANAEHDAPEARQQADEPRARAAVLRARELRHRANADTNALLLDHNGLLHGRRRVAVRER